MHLALILLAGFGLFAYSVTARGSVLPSLDTGLPDLGNGTVLPDLGSGALMPDGLVPQDPDISSAPFSSLGLGLAATAGAAAGGKTIFNSLGFEVPDVKKYTPPAAAAPYIDAINSASAANGLPDGLLARLLYQESRYRPEVINGTVRSGANAVGIAQIVPKWHPDVDATNPTDSINYAAGYLKSLYNQFGTWSLALAAYNWGPGNLKSQGINAAPLETRNYVSQITTDTGVA